MQSKILPWFTRELRDPRYFQLLYLSLFLVYGIFYLGWETELDKYVAVFTTVIITQLFFAWRITKNYSSIKSALITGLGLSLLLHSNSLPTIVLASAVAISSKFVLRSNRKHIYNPANIGLVCALLLGDGWISPGQWGSDVVLWFLVGAAGLMMILKVGRIDTSVTFLVIFGGLLFLRQVWYLGWEPSVWIHQLSNGSLLLFSFFMITDPMTTPNHQVARIWWAAILAVGLFILSSYFYIQTAVVWALFFLSLITPVFDKFFNATKYDWQPNNVNNLTNIKL